MEGKFMYELKFTTEDFKSLGIVDKYNKQHWKGGTVGWNYDVNKNNPGIKIICKFCFIQSLYSYHN